MRVGLLWLDNDPKKGLAQRMEEAVRRYEEKFGKKPNTCYVHPADLGGHEVPRQDMRIVAAANVLKNHLWVGWDDSLEAHAA